FQPAGLAAHDRPIARGADTEIKTIPPFALGHRPPFPASCVIGCSACSMTTRRKRGSCSPGRRHKMRGGVTVLSNRSRPAAQSASQLADVAGMALERRQQIRREGLELRRVALLGVDLEETDGFDMGVVLGGDIALLKGLAVRGVELVEHRLALAVELLRRH